MKKYRKNLTLEQPLLLPPRLDDWLPKGHLVYFIIDVVEMLDLSELVGRVQSKDPRGARPYDPKQLLTLLFYGYATGVFSSRRLARACEDNVACRIIMGSQFPHFTVIAAFRRRHLDLLPGLFTQVGQICLRAGLIGGENVVLDGTKIKANASRHAAMSYERMKQDEARLAREIEEWLRKAEQQDEQDESDTEANSRDAAMAEVKRREDRLARIRAARESLERDAEMARAAALRERAATHAAAAENARNQGDDKEASRKEKLVAKAEAQAAELVPEPPPPRAPREMPEHQVKHTADAKPDKKAQRNFTDPESTIAKASNGGFDQSYNGQAMLDEVLNLIVAEGLSNQPADSQHMVPMVERTIDVLGNAPSTVTADAGYTSASNVEEVEALGVTPYMPAKRERRTGPPPQAEEGAPPKDAPPLGRLAHRMKTATGLERMRKRKSTVELVFGNIKHAIGFRQFHLRGIQKARGEWALVCIAYNIRKVFTALMG